MFKPLIKYTGGKFNEYKKFSEYIPVSFNDYYEPFVGGGGVLFRLLNEGRINGSSHINDFSSDLIGFYNSIKRPSFSVELNKLSDAWDFVRDFSKKFCDEYSQKFKECMVHDKETEFVDDAVSSFISDSFQGFPYNTHGFSIIDKIASCLSDKLSRFRKKNISDDDHDAPIKSIKTSICQAFYFIIRDMYNDWRNNEGHDYTEDEKYSHWFFIREYCFGSMFRFGKDGKFNIPYGGYSYNDKCFNCKIEKIVNKDLVELFNGLDIMCCDFEEAIDTWSPKEGDFMFLDPPYDSTFSDYDDNSFGKKEHIRLANCLKRCKCKWLIAIGKTDFIYDLYKDYNIVEYDKTYMYQARGEYENKHTTHLVITNYQIDDIKTLA